MRKVLLQLLPGIGHRETAALLQCISKSFRTQAARLSNFRSALLRCVACVAQRQCFCVGLRACLTKVIVDEAFAHLQVPLGRTAPRHVSKHAGPFSLFKYGAAKRPGICLPASRFHACSHKPCQTAAREQT